MGRSFDLKLVGFKLLIFVDHSIVNDVQSDGGIFSSQPDRVSEEHYGFTRETFGGFKSIPRLEEKV
jgi:hypothetical protein